MKVVHRISSEKQNVLEKISSDLATLLFSKLSGLRYRLDRQKNSITNCYAASFILRDVGDGNNRMFNAYLTTLHLLLHLTNCVHQQISSLVLPNACRIAYGKRKMFSANTCYKLCTINVNSDRPFNAIREAQQKHN